MQYVSQRHGEHQADNSEVYDRLGTAQLAGAEGSTEYKDETC